MTRAQLRAPQILEMELQGKTQQQIADTLGVSRMQIYNDRQSPIYQALVTEFFEAYKDTLIQLLKSEKDYPRIEGFKELGRMYRAGMTRHTQKTHDIHIEQRITVEEKRRKSEELIKKLELTPDQFKVLEKNVKSESSK